MVSFGVRPSSLGFGAGRAVALPDYSLLLASNNYSGINLHSGTGKSVANSVGGFLPGDVLLKLKGETSEQIASLPHPFYTPIATFGSEYVLEPVAYGLKFAGLFSGGSFLPAEYTAKLQTTGVDATAYAAMPPSGHAVVVVLNKDAARDLEVKLDFGTRRTGTVETTILHASSLESREAHLTHSSERVTLRHCKYTASVRRATGACLTLK